MTTYRTGNHWGVTIVRSTAETQERAEGDELVAVVVNGNEALAERICALLNADDAQNREMRQSMNADGEL